MSKELAKTYYPGNYKQFWVPYYCNKAPASEQAHYLPKNKEPCCLQVQDKKEYMPKKDKHKYFRLTYTIFYKFF